MTGDTGCIDHGESFGNQNVQQHDIQSVVVSIDQANGTCPYCGQVPIRKYGDVSANDHSMIIQGDVHALYHCPNLGPLSETTRHEIQRRLGSERNEEATTHTEQISLTSSELRSPAQSNYPSPITTHTTRSGHHAGLTASSNEGNTGRPDLASNVDLAVETLSPASLIGLKVIKSEVTDSDVWKQICRADDVSVALVIQDAQIPDKELSIDDKFTPSSRNWKSCAVSLDTHQESGLRRVSITDNDAGVLWIPETMVAVICNDTELTIKFSNCNKLQPPGHYKTVNGRPMVVTTYDPQHPNVTLKFNFANVEDSTKFGHYLLCKDVIHDSSDEAVIAQTHQATMLRTRRKIGSESQKSCISVWNKNVDANTQSIIELHDIIAISDGFDLDLVVDSERLKVGIGYIDRLTYYPAYDPADLSQYVKRSADGGPANISVEGSNLATSRFEISPSATEAEELINRILSDKLSWKLKTIFPSVDVRISEKRKWGSDRYAAQVTLWSESEEHLLRILIRTYTPPKSDRRSDLGKIEWFSISLKQQKDCPVAELKDKVITIKKVDCTDGDRLSTSDLRTLRDEKKEPDAEDKTSSIDLELAFGSTDQVRQFQEVAGQFLSMEDN